jgi:hypothetical protein
VGKTTVALAYAEKLISQGRQVLYLNLEPFSSIPAYFEERGKSISAVFEMLENNEGNIGMMIRGIRRQDSGGIFYFCRPDNYDDMNVLSTENISMLVNACAGVTEELIVDMSCVCDERTRQIFDLSDRVFLVTGPTSSSDFKLSQFASQNDVFERIKERVVTVANMDAAVGALLTTGILPLPLVQSADPSVIYRTLAGCGFAV